MTLSEQRIRELELPINRTSYHLGRGIPESEITPQLIGFDVEMGEIPDIIAVSKGRVAEANIAYRKMTRDSARWYMAGGLALLVLIWLAVSTSEGDVPGRFQGRAIWGSLFGIGLLLYGAWRWIDPSYRE